MSVCSNSDKDSNFIFLKTLFPQDYIDRQSRTANKGWSSSLWLFLGLTAHLRNMSACYEMLQTASDTSGSSKQETETLYST
jgi:hypothetical protein